ALFDFALEPFAEHVRHYWFWEPMKIPSWQGAPMTGFFTWAIFTALILVFVTPLLIAKQLSKRRGPDFHPLALWLGAIVFFGAGCAIERLWVPAAADAAIVLVAAAFAIRGALW
ncbi:MAG: carotenoid biosynthesis protein, partial [Verrucomicrobia bacterium]|nr:carotenoid biosynthesis protein [Verrucomicrobiota bacterium]